MAGFPDDFLRFLQVNFPDAYRRASVPDVSEETVTSIMSTYGHRFQIWKEIPDWIKGSHGDRVPPEVLNGNFTVHDYVEYEKAKNIEKEKQTEDLLSFSVSMLALGYATETVAALTENYAEREKLLAEAGGDRDHPRLTPEQHKRWLESRRKDFEAIRNDWEKNQPEKHILRLAKELSRAKKGLARLENEEAKERLAKRVATLEKQLHEASERLNSRGSRQNMVDYLRVRSQQAALRHMHPEVLHLLTEAMERQRIRIEPAKGNKAYEKVRSLFNHNNLSQAFKSDFAQMEKSAGLTEDVVKRIQKQDDRIIERAEIKKEKKERVAKTVRMRASRGSSVRTA